MRSTLKQVFEMLNPDFLLLVEPTICKSSSDRFCPLLKGEFRFGTHFLLERYPYWNRSIGELDLSSSFLRFQSSVLSISNLKRTFSVHSQIIDIYFD